MTSFQQPAVPPTPPTPITPATTTDIPTVQTKLEPEYAKHYYQWKSTPSPSTRSQLLKTVNPVIDEAVHSYGGASRGSPVLRSRARMMALKSFDTYDPVKGTMKTHMLSQLRSLQRAGAQEANIISMPEQVALDRQHLMELEMELEDRLGRTPSDNELADSSGLSLKRLTHIRQGHAGINTGRIAPTDENNQAPAVQIPGQDNMDAWTEFVYQDLTSPRDQMIMEHALGLHGKKRLPPQEIAKRLGITPSAVSQRSAKIQASMDEYFDYDNPVL